MGHNIVKYGVRVDLKNISAMQEQACPKTLKNLHGFLGLTSYYRKIVKDYGKIGDPFASLLNKNYFSWNEVAKKAFSTLKKSMCNTPILAVLNFSKTFVLECDALDTCLGVVLMQEGCPLACTSKQLCDKNLGKSTYEKEMMAILPTMET